MGELLDAEVIWFVDNDRSASREDVVREDYQVLLGDLRAGYSSRGGCALAPGDYVIAWNLDRLFRRGDEREEFIRLARRGQFLVRTCQGDEADLATATGRLNVRLKGAVNTHEVEQLEERVERALLQNAERGTPHGPTAFGWDRVPVIDERGNKVGAREVVNPQEAAIVVDVARRLVAGESLKALTAELNRRGVVTSRGNTVWRASSLRNLMTRPRNIARRVHRGKDFGPAAWEPIMDGDLYAQVCALLDDPRRRTTGHVGAVRRNLLTGIALCGVCGRTVRRKHVGVYINYACVAGCVSRRQEFVDEHVTNVVIEWLASEQARELLAAGRSDTTRAALAEAATHRAKLDRAADQYGRDVIDEEQLARITAYRRPLWEAALARSREMDATPVWADLVGDNAQQRWASLTLDRQRSVIRALFTMTIKRVGKGRVPFTTASIGLEPRAAARAG